MGNTIGKIFKLTTFGESHGLAVGGVIDGCPSGIKIDINQVQDLLNKRKPGQSNLTSCRKESDSVSFLSGIFDGKSTGAPIAFLILNQDQRSKDYEHLKNIFRPSHADFTYHKKYGVRDYKGGGRSSARETANWVVAGAIAIQILQRIGINIKAYVSSVGDIKLKKKYLDLDLSLVYSNIVRCPDINCAKKMILEIEKVKNKGDTIGGEITVIATGVPVGIGEPIFDKLHSDIAKAMLTINAVHGFKYGFEKTNISSSKGSQVNDFLIGNNGKTKTNYSGGIQGGISNGNDIFCEVMFKPVSSIMQNQNTIDFKGKRVGFKVKGRHDPCVVPRAVPIVESMLALTLIDHYLRSLSINIEQ